MKKVTFFIGNGFDCKNKLETDYNSFLDYYLSTDSSNPVVHNFQNAIRADMTRKENKTNYGKWSYLEKQMGQYDPGNVEDFLTCYDDIYSHICSYLKEWDDKKYDPGINKGKNKEYLPVGFMRFLSSFYINKSSNSELDEKAKVTLNEELFEFRFISLNYTNLIIDCVEKMIEGSPLNSSFPPGFFDNVKIKECLYPHGKIPEVVFGVSNSSQLINPEYLKNLDFKCRMIKEEQAKKYGISDFYSAFQLINNSDIICLYGASIGETDDHWWKACCDWLQSNPEHIMIIYAHETNEKLQDVLSEKILSHLRSLSDGPTDISKQIMLTFDEQQFAEMFVDASASSRIRFGSSAFATVT